MTVVAADGREDIIMSIERNIFCWHGISTDLEQAGSFYSNVLGWQVTVDPGGAPVCVAPGGAVAHLQAPENGPPSWCTFLSVDDLDASTALAAKHGSSVLVPPTDLPAGRFSVVTTPSGAVFGLYQAVAADEMAAPGPGTIHWVELRSTSVDDDLAWFASVFGFSHRTQEHGSGPYRVLEANGVSRGGVTTSADVSAFVAWVEVDDLDATLARVDDHGGRTVVGAHPDPMVGRKAVVADPGGASFGLVQPAAR